ncbi:hypothetical protein [Viridibacillus arvi]|nr:hypothetical protein [Viridibacillus arvi]
MELVGIGVTIEENANGLKNISTITKMLIRKVINIPNVEREN